QRPRASPMAPPADKLPAHLGNGRVRPELSDQCEQVDRHQAPAVVALEAQTVPALDQRAQAQSVHELDHWHGRRISRSCSVLNRLGVVLKSVLRRKNLTYATPIVLFELRSVPGCPEVQGNDS